MAEQRVKLRFGGLFITLLIQLTLHQFKLASSLSKEPVKRANIGKDPANEPLKLTAQGGLVIFDPRSC